MYLLLLVILVGVMFFFCFWFLSDKLSRELITFELLNMYECHSLSVDFLGGKGYYIVIAYISQWLHSIKRLLLIN